MERKIVPANESDKENILSLYKTMLYGPADWNEYYPNEDTINFDLSRNALYVMKDTQEQIIATISIDEDKDVDKLPCWGRDTMPGGEISRLCVRQDMQNKGIAKEMIRFVFDVFKNEGKKGVHILVKTGHTAAISSYSKIGFRTVGECNLFNKDFICMEICL